MEPLTTQLQFLLIAVAGWMSRHQQAVIEYLPEENRILLEQLGGKPKRFTDAQRIRLARKAKLVVGAALGNWPHSSLQIPCSVGFVFWSPKSGLLPGPIQPADHAWMQNWKNSLSNYSKKTQPGAASASWVRCPRWATSNAEKNSAEC